MKIAVLKLAGLIVLLSYAVHFSVGAVGSDAGKTEEASSKQIFIQGLTDQNGKSVTRNRLFGKPAIVHFGFTHCPVVCPTTLHEVGLLMQRMGAKADKFNFIFATVDPERDTASVLKEYIGNFDERIWGLTGSQESIAKLTKHFGATYAKRPADEGYNVDHAIFAYLTDTGGKVVSTLYLGTSANHKLVEKRLEQLLSLQ